MQQFKVLQRRASNKTRGAVGRPVRNSDFARSGVEAAAPRAVVGIGAIDAVEAVGAEEVALGLDHVGGAAAAAVAVEVAECRGQRRRRQAAEHGRRNDAAQCPVGFLDHGGKGRGDDQVGGIGRLGEGGGDFIQELRADDAAGAPDLGDRRHRQRPVEFLRGGGHDGKALSIGADLGGQQRVFQVLDEGCLIGDLELADIRQAEDLLGGFALILGGRDAARGNGRFDRGCRNAHVLRFDHRPLAGALLAGLVEDQVDDRLAGQRIRCLQAPFR